MRFLFSLFLINLATLHFAFAQDSIQIHSKEKISVLQGTNKKISQLDRNKLFSQKRKTVKNMFCVFASANTNGWSGGIGYGRKKNDRITNWYTLSLSEIKDDKEEKIKPSGYEIKGYGKPRPYIYGKQNSFYPINMGIAQRRLLVKGFISPSVNISVVYGVDLSLGVLKPYYLKIRHIDSSGKVSIVDEKYSATNADEFLSRNKIYSKSNFDYGIADSKIIPGLQLHFGPAIDFGKNGFIYTVICGINLLMYTEKLPLIIDYKIHFYTIGLFAGLAFELE